MLLKSTKKCLQILAKNISKNLSSKYSKEVIDHARQSVTVPLKTSSKREIQKRQKQPVI